MDGILSIAERFAWRHRILTQAEGNTLILSLVSGADRGCGSFGFLVLCSGLAGHLDCPLFGSQDLKQQDVQETVEKAAVALESSLNLVALG